MTAHWGIEDPATVDGPDIEKEKAFFQTAKYVHNIISVFLSLPLASIAGNFLQRRRRHIGGLEGSTARKTEA